MNKKTDHLKKPSAVLMKLIIMVITLLASTSLLAAVHNISLTAETLPNGQLAYSLNGGEAVIPGPTIFVEEGDQVMVTLTNNTSVPVGFDVPQQQNPSSANAQPGQTRSYQFTAESAGSYVYHGNNGKEMLGLFGAIIVDKAGKIAKYINASGKLKSVPLSEVKKQFTLFMVGSTFWGTEITSDGTQIPLWANPTLGAKEDDIVRFHVLSVGPAHTFHMHAHRWLKEGTSKIIDTKLLADGVDSHSFTIQAGSGVGEGHWQFHCHLVSHMEAGMHGNFVVGKHAESVAGASPYGNILLGDPSFPGLVTFEISDEPGSWFRSARGDAIVNLGLDIKTKSLEVIGPGSSVNFVMSDTNAVHTITTLLWPTGAAHMPFDQEKAYKGGAILRLDTPGLYVFTCKVHPYMFGAIVVDDPNTVGLDLGNPAQDYKIDLVTGIAGLPTNSDLAIRLLQTFFTATAPNNWQDFSAGTWNQIFPALPVRISGAPRADALIAGGVSAPLSILNQTNVALSLRNAPAIPGIGEVWINTQFEKTAGKTKPGTITVIDASDWSIKRKIALPGINMNNPHNMWSNSEQSIIFQTQWFDNKLTFINRENGSLIDNIQIGNSPSHVMTLSNTDDITVAINGENGVAIVPAGTTSINEIMPTQPAGHTQANPHGHWITHDGAKIVTPNINTNDIGIYSNDGSQLTRTATGNNVPGAHPIAIGLMPDSSKAYASNLLHHSVSVVDVATGNLLKTINLIADYHPITGAFSDGDGNGEIAVGVLPIQIPVSPDGKAVVLAATGGQIVIIDTVTDTIVKMLGCDPGCHGVNFGAKAGGGYYAYVTNKFSNRVIVVDIDPNGDGNISDADYAGDILMVAPAEFAAKDDTISGLPGFGGQGILAVPNVYNGWVQQLNPGNGEVADWVGQLTDAQRNPIGN